MSIVRRIVLWIAITLSFLIMMLLIMAVVVIDPFGMFTIVPPSFSNTHWSMISKGMTKDEVLRLLPQPIERCKCGPHAGCSEYWQYSCKRSWNVLFRDFKIFFDENELVLGKKNEIDCD